MVVAAGNLFPQKWHPQMGPPFLNPNVWSKVSPGLNEDLEDSAAEDCPQIFLSVCHSRPAQEVA